MDEWFKVLYVCFAIITGLIVIWWLGMGIAWEQTRYDHNRVMCIQQTHDALYCNREW